MGKVSDSSSNTCERFGREPMENRISKKTLKDKSSISQDLQGIKKNLSQVNAVAAGIVEYTPDHNRLIQCIKHMKKKQVACIIIYDNSSEKESNFDFGEKVIYISLHRNDGVAHALNEIFKKVKALGNSRVAWVILNYVLYIN